MRFPAPQSGVRFSAPAGPGGDAEELRARAVEIYIHAPDLVNVATLNNKIRVPSRKIISQHAEAAAAIGAKGLIVHGGHVNDGDDIQLGIDNGRKTFEIGRAQDCTPAT